MMQGSYYSSASVYFVFKFECIQKKGVSEAGRASSLPSAVSLGTSPQPLPETEATQPPASLLTVELLHVRLQHCPQKHMTWHFVEHLIASLRGAKMTLSTL